MGECEEGTRALGGSYQIGRATRKEILDGCAWLVSGVSSGDKLFFHYSGHGTQVADTDGDEEDGMDEALCPADFRVNGVIVDDLLHEVLVRKVPAGVQLTAIMDCCHSGTVLDLPYIYQAKGDKPKESIKVEKKKKKSKKKKDKDKKDKKDDKKEKKDKKDKDKKKKGGKRDLDSDVNVEDIDLRRQFEEATRGIVGEECEEGTRALGGSYQIGRATRKEILDGCAWLVSGVSSGDKLFFHYSGHGTQVADTD